MSPQVKAFLTELASSQIPHQSEALAAALAGQPKTRRRRREILALFFERANAQEKPPPEALKAALQTNPNTLIADLRRRDKGRLRRVRDRQLREDILLIKRALTPASKIEASLESIDAPR